MKTIDFWPENDEGCFLCCICKAKMEDYEPSTCCSGYQCGCMGMPTEPSVCSDKCWNELMGGNNERL